MSYPWDWKLILSVFRVFTKHYEGLEHIQDDRAYIFAANHIGLIDAPFITSVLFKKINHRVHFFAKEELAKKYGSLITNKIFQLIPVYWSEPGRSVQIAAEWLKAGESVAIFPEGRRNTSPILQPARTGVARLALLSRAPVVPIGYSGPVPSKPNEDFWRDFLDFFIAHQPVNIKVGEPISFPEYYGQPITKELLREVTDKIMQKIAILSGKEFKKHPGAA
jgi:1-acyl-sn-glycerol-3-phosphate acyltransferase